MTEPHKSLRRRVKRVLSPVMAMSTVAAGVLTLGVTTADAKVGDVGYGCAYYTNVSLFGGPYGTQGCGTQTSTYATANSAAPSVTLPTSGAAQSLTDSNGGKAVYGPAVMISSPYDINDITYNTGATSASTSAGTVAGSSVKAQAKTIAAGPSPFMTLTPTSNPASSDGTTGYAQANCSATSSTSKSGSATIKNGRVDTSTDANGYPLTWVSVPLKPTPNYRVNFTINNVGDSGYILFNEQIIGADNSITVNAMHMYMQGPTALGDVIIGQVKCRRV